MKRKMIEISNCRNGEFKIRIIEWIYRRWSQLIDSSPSIDILPNEIFEKLVRYFMFEMCYFRHGNSCLYFRCVI